MKKNISKKTFCLIVLFVIVLQLFLPNIVRAENFKDGNSILINGVATFNNNSNHFEYEHGDLSITKNGNGITSLSFDVTLDDEIVITVFPDEGYNASLLAPDGANELYGNSCTFKIGNVVDSVISLNPVFSNQPNPNPGPQHEIISVPNDSIQLQLFDNLGNALNYDIVKNDTEFFKAQAVVKYSYDNNTWFELSNFENDENLIEACNEYEQYTYAFINQDKVYVKVESMLNGKFVSLLEEKYNDKDERVNGNIVVNKIYELTTKNSAYKLEYNNGVYSVDWVYNDSDAPEDMKVKNGIAKIIKIGDLNVSSSGGNSTNGGYFRIKQGEKVTVELKPNYGYQLSEAGFNGFALVSGKDVNQFTFKMAGTNLHFAAMFVKTNDIINTSGNVISGASISGANKIVDTGNIKLEVSDLNISNKMKIEFEKEAGDSKILSYLDLELSNIVYKTANGTKVWENQMSELKEKITVTLKLKNKLSDKDGIYYIIREHNGVYEKLEATYDKEENTLTFKTDKFSEYAIAFEENVVDNKIETIEKDNNSSNPKTFDAIIKYGILSFVSMLGICSLIILKKKIN